MKIAILGFGIEGQAAYAYWQAADNQLMICDLSESLELPGDVTKQLGTNYLQGLDQFDLIVRSPGVQPRDIVAANSPAILTKVTSNTNEFFRVCPTPHSIGVTGTKGKGTTSTLIAQMLKAAGKMVHLGGNIGLAPLALLKEGITADDWVVLELSSFQLVDCDYSPPIAVCLMVVPEHLNWHDNFEDYVAVKSRLFAAQTAHDVAIYFADNPTSKKVVAAGKGRKLPYFSEPGAVVANGQIIIADQTICSTDELKLLGTHNWQNVCAAVTVAWQVTQDVSALKQVLTSFTGLEHRLEFVRTVDDISFYNDSFAATPDAAIAAMEAIPDSKVLIMGGFDRNLPIAHVAAAAKDYGSAIRKILLIGASANRLAEEFGRAGFSNIEVTTATTMPEIVTKARDLARPGDSVVLSPGFASFDMFKNFEDRGLQYKAAVEQL